MFQMKSYKPSNVVTMRNIGIVKSYIYKITFVSACTRDIVILFCLYYSKLFDLSHNKYLLATWPEVYSRVGQLTPLPCLGYAEIGVNPLLYK